MFRKPFHSQLISGGDRLQTKKKASLSSFISGLKPRRSLTLVGATLLGVILFFALILLLVMASELPDVKNARILTAAQSSEIFDRNGHSLYVVHGDENRTLLPFADISPEIKKAFLAIEDDQFYSHGGFDLGGLLKGICYALRFCDQKRGGSTITQQFIKNAFLPNESAWKRKPKELILAVQLENSFTKDEILEMYLNRIPFGSNAFGVERAANIFFGKSARDLNLAEASVLAAIPKAPTYFSPYGQHLYTTLEIDPVELMRHGITKAEEIDPNLITSGLIGKTYVVTDEAGNEYPIYLKGRVDFVLDRLLDLKWITQAEKKEAIPFLQTISFKPYREEIVAPHFVMFVKQLLESKFSKEQIEKGGLRVTTTLDIELQQEAEAAIKAYAEYNQERYGATNASLVALDPNDGQILAMVGSRDYWDTTIDGKVNVATRSRLPGSSFKPIVYAAAFLQGYAPSTVVYDVKTDFSDTYSPNNYDGQFRGPVSFRRALANSLNIPAVKATYLAGVPNVLSLARNLGLRLNQPDDWYGLSLGLGAGEVRLIDLVSAYAVFGNGGYRVEPVSILKIEDADGNIIEEYTPAKAKEQILDPQVAYLVNHILTDAEARPAGFWRDQLTLPGQINGAKTGTSNKKEDNPNYNPANPESEPTINVPFDTWTIGYTKAIAAGVWAGNNDGKKLALKADGLGAASRIWKEFMMAATQDHPRQEFETPPGIKWIKVSALSGKLPSKHTPPSQIVTEVFSSFGSPKALDDSYQTVMIDKVSGKLATEYTPEASLEEKAFFKHQDVLPLPKWQEAIDQWAKANHQDQEIPTEYDDVHTPDSLKIKPEIQITSPNASSPVSWPRVDVQVAVQSQAGIFKVEYYLDGVLSDTTLHPPYHGSIRLPKQLQQGSVHTLGAKVFDPLYRTNQSQIEVVIGDDTVPPQLKILSPQSGVTVAGDRVIPVQAEAYDSNGAIRQVAFYLNGTLQKTFPVPPYLWLLSTTGLTGEQTIRVVATDFQGNDKTQEVHFSVDLPTTTPSENKILLPTSGDTFALGEAIFIELSLNQTTRNHLKELIVFAKEKKGSTQVIFNLTPDQSASYYKLPWLSVAPGNYQLYFKVTQQDGKVQFSERVDVLVRN